MITAFMNAVQIDYFDPQPTAYTSSLVFEDGIFIAKIYPNITLDPGNTITELKSSLQLNWIDKFNEQLGRTDGNTVQPFVWTA